MMRDFTKLSVGDKINLELSLCDKAECVNGDICDWCRDNALTVTIGDVSTE